MSIAPKTLVGKSIEWRGVHHSEQGGFDEISTHAVTYETETSCYVTAYGKLVGEARYIYRKLNDGMAICLYYPKEYRGRTDIVVNAIFDFIDMKDRAVLLAGGAPFAVADGDMREVPTPVRS